METPLWTTAYAPNIEDIPQEIAQKQLRGAVDDPVNLLVHGPPGAGKTAGIRALVREAHEDPDNDFIEINVADFFNRNKTDIKNDPRFASFLTGKSGLSKRDMINHVLKESASYSPVTGNYKTLLLDNAEEIREDFQQALRRVMEQYHQNTQFVIATRQPTKLIPALRSRCVPVPMAAPSAEAIAEILQNIVEEEKVEYTDDGIEFIANYADGNIRKAILGAQATAYAEDKIDMNAAYQALDEIGPNEAIESMLDAAESGEFKDARSELDDLLIKEGLSGNEILSQILATGRSRYDSSQLARLYQLAGEIDMNLTEGTNERVQIGRLLAEMGRKRQVQTEEQY